MMSMNYQIFTIIGFIGFSYLFIQGMMKYKRNYDEEQEAKGDEEDLDTIFDLISANAEMYEVEDKEVAELLASIQGVRLDTAKTRVNTRVSLWKHRYYKKKQEEKENEDK